MWSELLAFWVGVGVAAAAVFFMRWRARLRIKAKFSCAAVAGVSAKHFAGRYALGRHAPTVLAKSGFKLAREDGEVRLLGGACGEVLGGANLAALLRDGFELEVAAMEALESSEPAASLSIHTSAGTPPQLHEFVEALTPHVARLANGDDWCVNLQAEGASAVLAAVDMCLQAVRGTQDPSRPDACNRLACAASSYHGPASTSPGGGTPLGAAAKGLTHPVRYPAPTPMLRYHGETDADFHARLLVEFEAYLDEYASELAVLLVEPQWGSSVAALPWPPALLRAYIAAAKSRGIAVICDEIMCGLGRHGAEPAAGGTGCFLSECWDLKPDAVTFGKAIGGGAGHLLSGAILLHSASSLKSGAHGTAFQSHTYAGSSARALANGAALLRALPSWRPSVCALGASIGAAVGELNQRAHGAMVAHGQGGMWGGMFTHVDASQRAAASLSLKKRCLARGVLPYFVPLGGFMLTPRYDDDPLEFGRAAREVVDAALETLEEMNWHPHELLARGGGY